jgi:hypothetical protein
VARRRRGGGVEELLPLTASLADAPSAAEAAGRIARRWLVVWLRADRQVAAGAAGATLLPLLSAALDMLR